MSPEIDELPFAGDLRRKRADRRAHLVRKTRHAQHVARTFGIREVDLSVWARKNANNLKVCSCWMCGHVREHQGPKFSEIRQLQRGFDGE